MKENTRACVAYIAGCFISNKKTSSVYDQSRSKHFNINGSVESETVNIYDYERGCYVTGGASGADFKLLDHGNGKPITITFDKDKFAGYDEDSSTHFRGMVNGGLVSVFDYGESNWFRYNV